MLKKVAIRHFGTSTALARALGIGKQAVSNWRVLVPPLQASRLEHITHGELRFDPSAYSGSRAVLASALARVERAA